MSFCGLFQMAMISFVWGVGAQLINQIRFDLMGSRHEIIEETPPKEVEDKIYVAVGKDLKESQSTLLWALNNSGGRQICILHVHQPADNIPIMGKRFHINQLDTHQVAAYREIEKQNMHQILDKYKQICHKAGVSVELHDVDNDCIEKAIVEFIRAHNVKRLVMGAAANKYFSRRMVDLKSKKAIYVRLHAADTCQIQFICKGNIIFTRPNLVSEARRVIEPMHASYGLSSFRFGSEGRCQIPHYFICPIFQEIMQDPVVAADGYTYEAEALREWLNSGHNTSPMTNLHLANTNIVPNHTLRFAIQEWLQHP